MRPLNVGLIGCGRISDIYLKNVQGAQGAQGAQGSDELDLIARAIQHIEESRAADSIRVDH